jgi:hypothetical protein
MPSTSVIALAAFIDGNSTAAPSFTGTAAIAVAAEATNVLRFIVPVPHEQ